MMRNFSILIILTLLISCNPRDNQEVEQFCRITIPTSARNLHIDVKSFQDSYVFIYFEIEKDETEKFIHSSIHKNNLKVEMKIIGYFGNDSIYYSPISEFTPTDSSVFYTSIIKSISGSKIWESTLLIDRTDNKKDHIYVETSQFDMID
jgi:hypothetical protein